MNIEAKKRLFDARKACGLIAGFIAGRGFEEYTSDAMLSSAVERQFEIVGEALRLAELAAADPRSCAPYCIRSSTVAADHNDSRL